MPRRDGTGPNGEGASTGRGLGPCNDSKNSSSRTLGRGLGRNNKRGAGRGLGTRRNPK